MRKTKPAGLTAAALLGLACTLAAAADDAHALPDLDAPVPAQAPAPSAKLPIATLAEAQKAQQALEEFIRAYESGNLALLRSKLDPAMIGYQRFVDGMAQDFNRYKQLRLHLLDTQTLAGPDVAMIQSKWEKRFLNVNGLTPGIFSGQSQFLLHRDKTGWKVAAIAGDDPFSSASGVLGQINLAVIPGAARPVVRVEVVDPDLAGARTLQVQTICAASASVSLLPETTPGHFSSTVAGCTGPATFTVRYNDMNPGGGRPPSLLSRSINLP